MIGGTFASSGQTVIPCRYYSLAAAIFAALVVVLSKAGIEKVDPMLVFGIEAVCILVVVWTIIFAKKLQRGIFDIDGKVWIFLLVAGVLTTFSSLASFHSLKLGQASRTASFEKISLVFSVILSIIFLKDKMTWQVLTGVLLMVAGTLFIAFAAQPK